MTSNTKKGLNIIIVYIVVWLAVLILQLIISLDYTNSSGEIIMTDAELFRFISITNLALYLTLFIVYSYMLRSYLKKQIQFVRDYPKDYLKITMIGILGLFSVVYVSSIVMSLLGVTEGSENQEILNSLVDAALFDKIALIVFSVFLAPFVEEIVFRRAIYGFLENINIPLAIIVSGLSFGFIHVLSGDYIQLIIYGSLGLALAYTYYISNKNIITVITIHMIYNLIIAISMFAF